MTDIVKVLRGKYALDYDERTLDQFCNEAADEIEKLRKAVRGAEAWIDQWVSHIGSCRGDYRECTCGRAFVLRECQEVMGEK
jgi:hypothetical protein